MQRTIDDVIETLQNAKTRGRRCSLLVGAGCSVKAGIPTAQGFVDIIEKEYPQKYNRAIKKTYAGCMAELAPAERRDLIARYVDEAKINWGHIGIAMLLKHGFIDRVLTTNFDLLVARSCALINLFPAIYDFAASQRFSPADIPDKAVFYLHGQYTGFVLMNTEQEIQKHSELLVPVFEDAGRGRVWLVAGYSGENDPVFDHLARVPRFDNNLYWICYKDNDPAEHVRKRLLVEGKYAFYVKGFDADDFFVSLAQKLNCFPPDFVGKPFSYLNGLLELLTPYTLPSQNTDLDVTASARRWIGTAGEKYEPVLKAESALLAENYEQVISLLPKKEEYLTGELGSLISWAYVIQGITLRENAEKKDNKERDMIFSEAYGKYEAALRINPNFPEALNNWGITLYKQAMGKEGTEADRLFAQAYEKYYAAVKIKPNYHEALNNWGHALSEQGKGKKDTEADELFIQACEKYDRALKIKPDFHEGLNNWGITLSEHGKGKKGAEADELFTQAYKKYAAALKIKPNFPEALNNWGTSLYEQAECRKGAEADRLFAQAYEKYAAALKIKPDFSEAFNNWGYAIFIQAKRKAGEERDRLLSKAYKKYNAALEIKPDKHEALNNWGNALSMQAQLEQGTKADELFAQAYEKYAAALKIKPNFHEAVNNWGVALQEQAKRKDGIEADVVFAQAYEKYESILKMNSDKHEVLNNWANALSEQAKLKQGAEADELFARAAEEYGQTLAIKPDFHKALNNWGNALSAQAQQKQGGEAEQLFAQAREKLLQSETLSQGSGAYNLACVAALQGREDECREWLEKSCQLGTLPTREHLEQDTDLDSVREAGWFRAFLEKL